jgi:ABC-type phosphate transport system substrate-binding protein
MRERRLSGILVLVGLFLSSILGPTNLASAGAGEGENLSVVVNPNLAVGSLGIAELEAIFTSGKRTWPDGSSITAFGYAPDSEIRRQFDRIVLRMNPEEVARFWIDQRVRGGSPPPRQVPDPALAIRLVAKLSGSITYAPDGFVNSTVKVIARIKNGKLFPP